MIKADSKMFALIMIFFLIISTFLPYVPISQVQAETTSKSVIPPSTYTIESGGIVITELADTASNIKTDYLPVQVNSDNTYSFNLTDLEYSITTDKDYLVESKLVVKNDSGETKTLYDQQPHTGQSVLELNSVDLSRLQLNEYQTGIPDGYSPNKINYAFLQNGYVTTVDASSGNLVSIINPAKAMLSTQDPAGDVYNVIKHAPSTNVDFATELDSAVKLNVTDDTDSATVNQITYEDAYTTGPINPAVNALFVTPSTGLTVSGTASGAPFETETLSLNSESVLNFGTQSTEETTDDTTTDNTSDDSTDTTTNNSSLQTVDGYNVVNFVEGNISTMDNGVADFPHTDVYESLSFETSDIADSQDYQLDLVYVLEKNDVQYLYFYTNIFTGSEIKSLSSVSMEESYNQLNITTPTDVSVDSYIHVPNVNNSEFTVEDSFNQIENIIYDTEITNPYIKLQGTNSSDERLYIVEQVDLSSLSTLNFSTQNLVEVSIDDTSIQSINAADYIGNEHYYQNVENQTPVINVTPNDYRIEIIKRDNGNSYFYHTDRQDIHSNKAFHLSSSLESSSIEMEVDSAVSAHNILDYGDFNLNHIFGDSEVTGTITIEDTSGDMTPITEDVAYLGNEYWNNDLPDGDYTYTFQYPLPGQTTPITITKDFTLPGSDSTSDPLVDLSVDLTNETTIQFGGMASANSTITVALTKDGSELTQQQITTDDMGFLQGSFDLSTYSDGEFTVLLVDPSTGAGESASFTLDTSSGDEEPQPTDSLVLQSLNINTGSDAYIEFKTGNQDYTTANQMHFHMSGDVLPGVINETVPYIFNNSSVSLMNMDNTTPVSLDHVEGQLKSNADSSDPQFLYTGIRLGENATLNPNTTYRISFHSDAAKSIFSKVTENVYVAADSSNTELSIWDNTTDQEIAHKTTQVADSTITSDNTPTVQQFGGSNEAVLVGSQMVNVDLGDTSNMNDINKLKVVLESSENELEDYNVTSTFNEQGVTATTTIATQDLVTIEVTNDTTFNAQNSILSLESSNTNFTQVLEQVIQNPDANSLYVLGYNSANELVGYKKVSNQRKEVLVDPEFKFGDGQTEPVVGRFLEVEGGHTSGKSFSMDLLNTGDMNKDHFVVEGTTKTPDGEESYPFYITFQRHNQDGNFRGYFSIVGHYNERFKEIPADFDKQAYENSSLNDDNYFNKLPVNPGVRNTITLNYTNTAGDTVSKTFDWYPADSPDIFMDGRIQNTISSQSDEIKVDLRQFNGSMDKATLELYTVDADNNKTKVAVYDQAIDNQPKIVEEKDDSGQVIRTFNYSQIIFTQSADALNNLDTLNSQDLLANLTYNESYTNDQGEVVSTVSFEEGVGFTDVLTEALRPHVYNDGVVSEDSQTYYNFKVDFERRSVAQFTSENILFFNGSGDQLQLEEGTDYLVRGDEDSQNADVEYRRYDLLISDAAYQPGMLVEIQGVTDTLGLTMEQPVRDQLRMYTNVNSQLVSANGEVLSSENLIVVPNNQLANNNLNYVDRYHIYVDSLGKLQSQVEAGTYTVIGISDENNGDEENIKPYRFEFSIPVLSSDQVYQQNIVIPEPNITGNIKRESDYQLKETLVFMKQEHVAEYESLLAEVENSTQETSNTTETDATDEKVDEEEAYTAYDRLHHFKEIYAIETVTDGSGNFGLYLPDGTYELLGKKVGNEIVPPTVDKTFTVPGGDLTDLEIQEPSTFITLKDSEGNLVRNAHISVSDHQGFHVSSETNDEGKVGLMLPQEGTYYVSNVSINRENKSQLFLLNDTKSFENTTGSSEHSIQLPEPNVHFDFGVDGNKVTPEHYASIEVEGKSDGEYQQLFGSSMHSGELSAYLPSNDYKISYVEFDEIQQTLDQPFTVNGTTPITQTIELGNSYNAYVKFVDKQGNGLADYHVEVEAKDRDWSEYGKTNENGEFLLNVPQEFITDEGTEISVIGYDDQSSWNQLEGKTFIIDSSHSAENRAGLTIELEGPNFNGYVLDPDSGERIKDAWLQVRNQTTQQSYSYQISNEGTFNASIQEAGDYIIEGVGTREKWIEIQHPFVAETDENGDIQLLDQQGNALELPIELTEVQPNFFGKLYQKYDSQGNGIPYQGEFVQMILKEKDVSKDTYLQYPWLYEESVEVSADGSFETKLDSTKEYEVIAITTDQEYYRFESGIEIPLSETEAYEFTPQSSFTFSGEAYTYDNATEIIDGDMWLEKVTENEEEREGTSVRLHNGGVFGQNLQEGSIYIIRDMYYRTNKQEQHNRISLKKEITIGQNSKGLKLQPNVKGVISLGDLASETQDRMGALIRPVYTEDDFNDEAAYQDYKNNPWQYEVWVDMKQDTQDPTKANFYTYLDAGTYKLRGMDVNGSFMDLNETFTIDPNASSENIAVNQGEFQTKYQFSMDYTPNVTGTVQENGAAMTNAYVQIVKVTDEWQKDYEMDQYHFGVNTDQNGAFMLNLDDGNYRIEGYHTQGEWQGTQWVEGKFVPARIEFTVSGQQVTSRSGESLSNITIEPNIFGDIQLDTSSNSTAWFTIRECTDQTCEQFESGEPYWGNTTSSSKEFAAMLPNGHYVVTEAGAQNEWLRTNTQFEVSNEQLVGQDRLQVAEEEPNFVGTAYLNSDKSTPLKWGWMNIKPADAEANDWSNTFSINTNRNGEFSTKIKDGSWKIVSLGNQDNWKQVQIPFEVSNSTITSSGNGMLQQNESISIFPPAPNVTGTVEDKQGNTLSTNAWIAIKPADAGAHDWDQVHWAEYKYDAVAEEGSFGITLPAGEYKVVEVSSRNTWYKTIKPFEVKVGESIDLQIAPLEPTLEGTAYKDSTGTNMIQNGWITVARVDEQGTQLMMNGSVITSEEQEKDPNTNVFWQHTESTEINQGQFDMVLQNGFYKIISVGGEDTWYVTDQSFEIQNETKEQIDVQKPGDNVTITLSNVPEKYQSNQPYLMVTRTTEEESYGVELTFDSSSQGSYTFTGTLQDGNYSIVSLIGENNLPIEEEFTVQGSEDISIDLGASTSNQLVTGDVTLGGQEVTEAFKLEVQDANDETKVIEVEQDGTFNRPLQKGMTYTVTGMMNQSGGYKALSSNVTFTITQDNEASIQLDVVTTD